MSAQHALALAAMVVILFGLIASLMIREPTDSRKAKPFFVSFFVFAFALAYFLTQVPMVTSKLELILLDTFAVLNISSLSIGIAIRFAKPKIERICYFLLIAFLIYVFSGPHNLISTEIFFLVNITLIIWATLARRPKPNRADLFLILTLMMWAGVLIYSMTANPTKQDQMDLVSDVMTINYIFAPAYICGVSIFLLTSYMMDSNTLLERLASKDVLTDMLNRRALFEQISSQVNYLKRKNSPASIVLADIDHFKQINDSYGHEAGDKAIQQFAAIIKNTVRNYDISARYGGEEFLVFLPNADVSTAVKIAERIRAECEQQELIYDGNTIPFTASFGVTEFQFDKEPGVSVAVADQALYTSKSSGRNQVSQA